MNGNAGPTRAMRAAEGAIPMERTRKARRQEDVAIIGMSGRFPGARNLS